MIQSKPEVQCLEGSLRGRLRTCTLQEHLSDIRTGASLRTSIKFTCAHFLYISVYEILGKELKYCTQNDTLLPNAFQRPKQQTDDFEASHSHYLVSFHFLDRFSKT